MSTNDEAMIMHSDAVLARETVTRLLGWAQLDDPQDREALRAALAVIDAFDAVAVGRLRAASMAAEAPAPRASRQGPAGPLTAGQPARLAAAPQQPPVFTPARTAAQVEADRERAKQAMVLEQRIAQREAELAQGYIERNSRQRLMRLQKLDREALRKLQ